jgi:hypothetical protein
LTAFVATVAPGADLAAELRLRHHPRAPSDFVTADPHPPDEGIAFTRP